MVRPILTICHRFQIQQMMQVLSFANRFPASLDIRSDSLPRLLRGSPSDHISKLYVRKHDQTRDSLPRFYGGQTMFTDMPPVLNRANDVGDAIDVDCNRSQAILYYAGPGFLQFVFQLLQKYF